MMRNPLPPLCIIGPFHDSPELAGGVAVKNKFLIEELRRLRYPLDLASTYPRAPRSVANIILKLLIRKRVIISASQNGRAFLLPLAAALSLISTKNFVVLAGGGTFSTDLKRLPRPALAAYRMILNSISHTFLETRAMVEESLSFLGPCKLSHLPNFKPRPAEKATRSCNKHLKVVYVGRLAPTKGVLLLVDAVQRMLSEGASVELDVYGPFLAHHRSAQPEMKAYQDTFTRLVAERPETRYLGVLQPEAVQNVIRNYDVLAFPTQHPEGFPGVLIDAAFAGLAVVASDTPFTREIVGHDRNGLLFPPGDVHAMASALTRLHDDRKLCKRLGSSNWESSTQYDSRFAVQVIISHLLKDA